MALPAQRPGPPRPPSWILWGVEEINRWRGPWSPREDDRSLVRSVHAADVELHGLVHVAIFFLDGLIVRDHGHGEFEFLGIGGAQDDLNGSDALQLVGFRQIEIRRDCRSVHAAERFEVFTVALMSPLCTPRSPTVLVMGGLSCRPDLFAWRRYRSLAPPGSVATRPICFSLAFCVSCTWPSLRAELRAGVLLLLPESAARECARGRAHPASNRASAR